MDRAELLRRRQDLALLVGLAFILALVFGGAIYMRATSRLIDKAEEDLLLLETLRSSTLQNYLETTRSEVVLWSDHGPVHDGFHALAAAWTELGPQVAQRLRRLYVEENPYPAGERHLYERAPDGSAYSLYHSSMQPAVRRFLDVNEYYDIFLCDPDGNVLNSAYKETDFATNLVNGPWSDTDLGVVFREARDAPKGQMALRGFRRYGPSSNAPAAFAAGPVFDDDGALLGVLIFQLASERVNEIMQFTEGMGETGETYLVGPDLLMRSDSRFAEQSTILVQEVDTEAARRALDGESGVDIIDDYRGVRVISAYGPMEFEGLRWGVIAETDVEEVLEPAKRLRRNLFLVGLAVLVLVALAALVNPPPLTRNV